MKAHISLFVNNRGVERRCGFDVLIVIGCEAVPGSCPTAPIARVDFSIGGHTHKFIMYTVTEQTCSGSLQGRSLMIKVFFVVASRCSKNHFISGKYKTGQSFKLRSLQNSPLA
jgi:hypothetical protein